MATRSSTLLKTTLASGILATSMLAVGVGIRADSSTVNFAPPVTIKVQMIKNGLKLRKENQKRKADDDYGTTPLVRIITVGWLLGSFAGSSYMLLRED